jgi:hypothetical protein
VAVSGVTAGRRGALDEVGFSPHYRRAHTATFRSVVLQGPTPTHIRTASGDNSAIFHPLSPLAVPLLLKLLFSAGSQRVVLLMT